MNDALNKVCSLISGCTGFLERFQLLRPIELSILTVLCFAAGRLLTYFIGWGDAYFSGFWIILVALLVTKDAEIKLQDLQWRLFAIALGVAAGFIVVSVFKVNFVSLFIAVALVAWGCAFFNWHSYQQISIMSAVVLIVSNYLVLDMATWAGAVGRILEAAIGMLLAYGVHIGFKCITGGCPKASENKKP